VAHAEFHVAEAYRYDRRSAVRWIFSHLWRYPWLPAIFLLTTLGMAVAQSLGAVAIGRAFDTISAGADPSLSLQRPSGLRQPTLGMAAAIL
jgi:hypothetical protein